MEDSFKKENLALTIETVTNIINDITYKDWIFNVTVGINGFYFKIGDLGQSWHISVWATEHDILETVLKAIMMEEDEQICQAFLYKNTQIFATQKKPNSDKLE